MLAKYPGEITADLREYYNVDIVDVLTYKVPPAIVLIYITQLPGGARVKWAAQGIEPVERMDRTQIILADLCDAVQSNTIATGHWEKQPTFRPYPRPWDKLEAESRFTTSTEDMFEFLRAQGAVVLEPEKEN